MAAEDYRNAYDVAAAFARIEDDLISSMMRNFKRHKAKEAEEGIEWSQWQVEQLAALEEYKRRNRKKYSKDFSDINSSIERIIRTAKKIGMDEQEMQILEAVKRGAKLEKGSMTGSFFKMNDRKMNAMIDATLDHTKKAEVSILRVAEDKYRQTIFKAQMFEAAGGTYEKAIDMATKDFLAAGIQSVEYKNGSRHSVEEYTEMAIRTANTRAYLTGEGDMRNAWGEHLVIMNKRGNCRCAKCLKWLGRVLVDDVWSGGTDKDTQGGKYPLMSAAIEEGLYHPNCKDIHTTYFADVLDDLDDDGNEIVKAEEKQEVAEAERKAQEYNRAAEMEKRNRRLANYSLDSDNRRAAAARADEWQKRKESLPEPEKSPIEKKIEEHVEKIENGDIIDDVQYYRKVELDELNPSTFTTTQGDVKVKKVTSVTDDNFYISDKMKISPKQLHRIKKAYDGAVKLVGLLHSEKPVLAILLDSELKTNYGLFIPRINTVFIKYQVDDFQFMWTMIHELIHKKDFLSYTKRKAHAINDTALIKREKAKFKSKVLKFIAEGGKIGDVSDYATEKMREGEYDEVYTEIRTKKIMTDIMDERRMHRNAFRIPRIH